MVRSTTTRPVPSSGSTAGLPDRSGQRAPGVRTRRGPRPCPRSTETLLLVPAAVAVVGQQREHLGDLQGAGDAVGGDGVA